MTTRKMQAIDLTALCLLQQIRTILLLGRTLFTSISRDMTLHHFGTTMGCTVHRRNTRLGSEAGNSDGHSGFEDWSNWTICQYLEWDWSERT
jgi:hypothetical protein